MLRRFPGQTRQAVKIKTASTEETQQPRDGRPRESASPVTRLVNNTDRIPPGDDFFFLSSSSSPSSSDSNAVPRQVVLGVADGVGGWSESGVDPSVFSQALMYHAAQATDSAVKAEDEDPVYPHDILQKAYDGVMHEQDVVAGQFRLGGVAFSRKALTRRD